MAFSRNGVHALCIGWTLMLAGLPGPTLAKGTGYLFISSEKDDEVLVLDSKSHAVVSRINTSARPRHLQFSPDRTLMYAVCGEGEAIDIIDVNALRVVDTIPDIPDPELLDLSADGETIFVSLEDDGALGILDLEQWREAVGGDADERLSERVLTGSGRVGDDDDDDEEEDDEENEREEDDAEDGEGGIPGMRLVEVGEEPEGVMAHPDGELVYVTSEVANTVHVVDVTDGELVANIVVGKRPRRFAMTVDKSELWVTNELAGSLSIIDPAKNRVNGEIVFKPRGFRPEQVTPVGITMTRDGSTAYVALGRANHVAVVDVETREIEKYILVGERAWNTTLNRDESRLYVVNGLSDDVSIIDTASRRVIKSIPVGRVPHTLLIDD